MLDFKPLTSRAITVERAIDWQELITFEIPRTARDGVIMMTVDAPDFSQPSGAYQFAGAEFRTIGYGAGQPVILDTVQLGGGANAAEFGFGELSRFPRIKVEARGMINGAVGQQMSNFLDLCISNGVSSSFYIRAQAVALVAVSPNESRPPVQAADEGIASCR